MKCSKPHKIRVKNGATGQEEFRYVPCRICLGCRLTRQYGVANRLDYEVKRIGVDRCWFWTGTFRDRGTGFPDELSLPYSKPTRASVITPAQKKVFDRLLKIIESRYSSHDSKEWANSLITEMQQAQPERPTVSLRIMQLWKKRIEQRIGYLPRIIYNGEFGSKTGRPHNHAVILDMAAKDAQATCDAWPYSDEIKEVEQIQSDKIGSYIAKDLVKGSPTRYSYIASNREPPFMGYPKKPYLAQGQEEEIFRTLSTLQQSTIPYDFEHRVQIQHVGRTFETVKDGKKTRIPYGKTAYKKALARITRDEGQKECLAEEARSQAHFQVTHTDETHPHYLESHRDKFIETCKEAERIQVRAAQRHKALLHRKGITR